MITRAELAATIDYTLLRPEATEAEVLALCREAGELGVAAVCVSPTMVGAAVGAAARGLAARGLAARGLAVCSVIGFPSGAHTTETKAAEAAAAEAMGATELDMVIDLGAAKGHRWAAVRADVAGVRAAVHGTLKVIVESAALTDRELDEVAGAALDGGADYLKTSTGFHPSGGATLGAVAALARRASQAGRPVGVKASGGIRDAPTALAMLGAGATRLGCSSTRSILDGLATPPGDPRRPA